jgi:hypothetical protein
MACRTGCPTQDHESWGDCLRASNISMNAGDAKSGIAMPRKKVEKELSLYRQARAQGIQPKSTRTKDIQRAIDMSNMTGKAHNASK